MEKNKKLLRLHSNINAKLLSNIAEQKKIEQLINKINRSISSGHSDRDYPALLEYAKQKKMKLQSSRQNLLTMNGRLISLVSKLKTK